MADRYQDRPFPADDGYDRGGDPHAPARAESDPLAELARLIGQTDPFAMGRANQPVQPRAAEPDPYQHPAPSDDDPPAGPPPWMQRATRHEAPQQDYPEHYSSAEHPVRRYATPVALPEPQYHPAPSFAETDHEPDPSRYDEALYGQLDPGQQPHDPAYADDAYAYQDRRFPADDGYDRGGDPHAPARAESDPLAELARLIGQTDPFAMGRANQPVPPRAAEPDPYQPPAPSDDDPPAGPPPWMQRATRHEAPQEDYPENYPSAEHPLRRYATPVAPPEPEYHPAPSFAEADHEADPSRYDEALYGRLDPGQQPHDPAYADDAYAYQDGYADEPEDQVKKRSTGLITVVAVLALAVVGTGAAFAYRTYVGSPRSGEPPIIKADAGPTKIVPAPADGTSKVPDRMATGDGAEKIVPREEAPVDVNARSGPRVVFPPLNQNASPPPAASVASSAFPPASVSNGTVPGNEPRKIRTLAVKGDQADAAATPVGSPPPAKQAPAPRAAATAATAPALAPPPGSVAATRTSSSAANANASTANAPMSLTPQGGQPAPAAERTRAAASNPVQTAPGGSGGYLVQVASQKNEADAQASYRALQGKYPSVLASRSPVIKRADLGDKGVYYRAMVGPFGTPDEAKQFCGNLKTAGGQCVVQGN